MSYKIVVCDHCGAINRVNFEGASKDQPVCGKCHKSIPFGPSLKVLGSDKLDKVIRHAKLPVVVDIYADWCGPCKMYAPIFQNVSSKLWKQAEFYKIDSQRDPNFSASYNVRGIPTTLIFKDGHLVQQQSGLLNEAQLEQLISRV